MNSVALIGAALDDFPQENDIVALFLHGNTVIVDAGKLAFQLGQLMVVSGKQRLGAGKTGARNVFHHSPGDGQSVIGAGSPADLVEDQQAVFSGMAKNIGHFTHFHHKCTLPGSQVVGGSDSGKYPVHQTDARRLGRHKRADLRHQHDERRLTHVGGLSCHIRSGDHIYPVLLMVKKRIVRHKQIAPHHFLHHRMSSVLDVDDASLIDGRPHVTVLFRHHRQGSKSI